MLTKIETKMNKKNIEIKLNI